MKKTFILIISLVLTTSLFSQAPEAFNYQAIARDAKGDVLVNKAVSVLIEILNESSVVYSESHNVVTNQFGLLNLQVGKGTPVQSLFSDIDWSTGNYFISVSIDTNGGTDFTNLGSAQLLSVPYALYAGKSAGSVWQKNNDNIYYNKGKVGIGTSSPVNSLTVVNSDDIIGQSTNTSVAEFQRTYQNSNATMQIYAYPSTTDLPQYLRSSIMLYTTHDAKNLKLSATPTGGSIQFLTDGWVDSTSERMRITSSGDIGIGTTRPKLKLDINGGIKIGNSNNNYAGAIRWTGSDFEGYNGSSWLSLTGVGSPGDWTSSGNNIFYTKGNVSIGSTKSGSFNNSKLFVRDGWLQVSDSNDNEDAGIVISHLHRSGYGYARTLHMVYEGVNGDPFTEFRIRNTADDQTVTSWAVGADNSDADKFIISSRTNTTSGASPSFGTQQLVINTDGHIGIGNANPEVKLRIEDNITGSADNALIRLRNAASDSYTGVSIALESNDKATGTSLTHTSSTYTRIPDFNDMGVISTNGRGFSIYSYSDYGSIRFYTNHIGTDIIERMRIDSAGHVGIGTTTPQNALSIEGSEETWPGRIFLSVKNKSTSTQSLAYMTATAGQTGHTMALGYISDTYTANDDYPAIADYGVLASSGKGMMLSATRSDQSAGVIKFCSGQGPGNAFIERMRIDSTGNVGIGVTNPQRSLQVKDVMRLEPISTPPSSPSEGDIYMDATTHKLMVYDGTQWQACW